MAGEVSSQIWLTSALSDKDVPKALILRSSLKRVLTSRKVGVIVSNEISAPLKLLLYRGFDCIIHLDEILNTTLPREEFVKVFPLTLKSFEKIVFLSATMMAVKNCDEIFDDFSGTQKLKCTKTGDMSIFTIRPSLKMFEILLKGLAARNGTSFETYMRTWVENKSGVGCTLPSDKYAQNISFHFDNLLGNAADVSIVNMMDITMDVNTEKFGLLNKWIVENWKKIYTQDVKPLLSSNENFTGLQNIAENVFEQPNLPKEAIAIVGMSCRYPSANTLEQFWSLLLNSEDGTGTPPDYRWLPELSIRNRGAEHRATNVGFLKILVENFDSKFFGISPKEVIFLDPQHRLLHELVWEGLEDAGIIPNSLEGTNGGVFIGSWLHDYKDILACSGNDEFYRMYMGTSIGSGAARISHLLGLTGPSIATESGCSSAMVAVHLACKSLERGESNLALACGVNLLLHPFSNDTMPMVVSPTGHSKTFDAKADGFGRAEGCGVLVLKRVSDAVKDGDKIWALIRGSAMVQEGISKSMGTPTIQCESLAMTRALQDARVDPAHVSYVEAHGTGTIVGDPMEVAAIAKAYHSTKRIQPLVIGSVKTNVGHTESCSGITGIMKVVLSMNHEIIPAHINFETLNPAIDLDAVPAIIPLQSMSWPKEHGKRRLAGVSSFGITGTDAHAIIEEPPKPYRNSLNHNNNLERPLHIMKITAKTKEALDILVENYKNHLTSTDSELTDLAYTANTGRSDFQHRAVIIAKSKNDAVTCIEKNKFRREECDERNGKICFLFTGQGSQYPGMAKQLYETSPVFRMHFEYCAKLLKQKYNIEITQVLWPAEDPNSGEISRTIYSQTSIFCVEYALLKLWESWGVMPDFALGHSLGEFAAAVCAGIIVVEDALELVAERSRLIDELPRGKMLVIKANKHRVDALLQKFATNDPNKILDYAAINSQEQTVVAGDSTVAVDFADFCKNSGLKCVVLEATHAFHSRHMNPMLDEYRLVAEKVNNLGGGQCTYISGMRGDSVNSKDINAKYWAEHTREKVLFMRASQKAVELGCTIFVEIGPQPVLSALTMLNNDRELVCLPSLKRNVSEWETLLNTLGELYLRGVEVNWKGIDQFYNRRKVRVPHYPFMGKRFWPNVIATNGTSIHPLLGSVIPNASPSKLFESNLSLAALEYVKDHAIGDNVIFPGAGYLEICLAAGLATIEGNNSMLSPPTRAMKVDNLLIDAPLSLQESTICHLQTVTELITTKDSKGDWNDISIKIVRRFLTESSKWQTHARATFSPVPTPEEKAVLFDPNSFFETLKRESENGSVITQIYDKLAAIGLKFGPTFRSIEKVWKEKDGGTLLAKVKLPTEELTKGKHIVHPVILDAMIQGIMMNTYPITALKKSLYVPIKIGKFVWLSRTDECSSEIYVHVQGQGTKGSAMLVNSAGKVLAVMSSVELIDTTVKAMESILEEQLSSMPDCWEVLWRKTPNPVQFSADIQKAKEKFYTEEFHKEFETKYNIPSEELSETFQNLERFVYLNILRGLYESGWEPELHKCFAESSLFHQLGIQPEFRKYFAFICEVLETEGILHKTVAEEIYEPEWTLVREPPSYPKALALLSTPVLSNDLVQRFESTLLLQKVGENLSSLFKGSKSALSVLFPEGPKMYPSISDFYGQYGQFANASRLESVGDHVLKHIVNSQQNAQVVFRILEVGAGTGACTEKLLSLLTAEEGKCEYFYTDISAAFFPAAEKRFENFLSSIKFKKLNIEEDPIGQGFIPDYFDFVFAGEVIHATKDITQSLHHIHILMKPWARFVIQETTKVNRIHTFLFGTLDGYWRFEDFDLRQKYCILDKEAWISILEKNGLQVEGIFSVFNNDHSYISALKMDVAPKRELMPNSKLWLLFHQPGHPISDYLLQKIQNVLDRKVITVTKGEQFSEDIKHESFLLRTAVYDDFLEILARLNERRMEIEGVVYCWALDNTETTQEMLLQPYFHLTKSLLSFNFKTTPRLSLITGGVLPLEGNDMSCFQASTLWGYSKSMKNENFHFNCRCIEVADGRLDESRMQEIFHEIWSSEKENQVAFQGTSRYVPKFHRHKVLHDSLKIPVGTDRYQLILPETNSISDLSFGPLDTTNLKEDEVEVQVKCSALNFRDILSIIKPSEDFKNVNTVGFDFAGVIRHVGEKVSKWKVGDRVCGCNIHFTAMPSHLTLPENLILPLPDNVSFGDGATMPAVYMTSVLCLIEVAKIKKEDTVLIHTASGGVGLSAIEICKHVGCTVIATAGSKRKQNYLRSLGIQHIFNSRTTHFGSQILEVTNGRGVDVVLNSLTGEGFKEATLRACATGARFVEMSKLNIWAEADIIKFRPDVKYTTIDLSQSKTSEWVELLNGLGDLSEKNVVRPIPYVRFDALNIRAALEYMQKAKHIGKVVCTMPELRNEDGQMKLHTPCFNEQSTYLITGGLGGIGFVVAMWMVDKGAKHVVLASRSSPSISTQAKINEMNAKGANIISVQLDVGNFEQCKDLLKNRLPNIGLPPLRGVMHAAGTLSDGLIVNQEWTKLSTSFTTKVCGSLNLHELTKEHNLEHFVLFSSVVALFGTSGQSNHAAANMFEDSLAHYRHSIGLPATTVNWGQWGEVGVAKEIDLPGLKVLSNLQGVAGLEYIMSSQRLQTIVANVGSFVLLSKILPQLPVDLDESIRNVSFGSNTNTVIIKSEEFWQQYDSKWELGEKIELLKKVLETILRNVLKMDESDTIDDNANLQEMGVDSLMFVEIKNSIQAIMGERLVVNASSIKDCSTVHHLAETLVRLIEGEQMSVKPTKEEVKELIREDCYLPEHISSKDGQTVDGVEKIRTVLLTGATGTLGPYILKQLADRQQITKIICVIQPRQNESEKERLMNVLKKQALQVDMGKVRCVAGNVADFHLGMELGIWEELVDSVDAVFHCAARVEHAQFYNKHDTKTDIRATNIGGTKKVLEFACEKRLKYVYYSSSIIAVTTMDADRVSERWPDVGDYDGVASFAYPITKFVGDVLMKQAVERGIPCKVFRFPLIVGESKTGRCNIENNHGLMRYMFIMKNGIMPSSVVPMSMIPVDVCADISVSLFFDERAGPDCYNIIHKKPAADQEFVNVAAKFGYNVDFVDFSEFAQRVNQTGSALEIFGNLYDEEDVIIGAFAGSQALRKWIEERGESSDMWVSRKVEKLLPSFYEKLKPVMDYVYNDLLFCKNQGWFESFGL